VTVGHGCAERLDPVVVFAGSTALFLRRGRDVFLNGTVDDGVGVALAGASACNARDRAAGT